MRNKSVCTLLICAVTATAVDLDNVIIEAINQDAVDDYIATAASERRGERHTELDDVVDGSQVGIQFFLLVKKKKLQNNRRKQHQALCRRAMEARMVSAANP